VPRASAADDHEVSRTDQETVTPGVRG
jgi:hypothetical protein